jgi:hypothetical protein
LQRLPSACTARALGAGDGHAADRPWRKADVDGASLVVVFIGGATGGRRAGRRVGQQGLRDAGAHDRKEVHIGAIVAAGLRLRAGGDLLRFLPSCTAGWLT